MDWIKTNAVDVPTWNYKQEGKDSEIQGVYTGSNANVGPNKSMMYYLKKEDKTSIGIWGSSLLDKRFEGIKIGEEVKIIYLGKATGKSGRDYHNFEVYHRPVEESEKTIEF